MFCRWRRPLEKSDIYLRTAGKTYGCNSCTVHHGYVLECYPLQTYIQQMVVTLDYSTMNVDQIAQAMKLNNLSLDSAKIFIAMIPVLIVYPFLQRYFVEGITLGSVKG